jgi:hypothetical protein
MLRPRGGPLFFSQIAADHRASLSLSLISGPTMSQLSKATYVDDLHAPQVFADDVSGYWVNAGCVHITLDASRVDHSSERCGVTRVAALRLTLPIPIAQVLAVSLYDFLKQRGLAPESGSGH